MKQISHIKDCIAGTSLGRRNYKTLSKIIAADDLPSRDIKAQVHKLNTP
ncbi:hypothetical protein [Zunongwangia pacifica]|uniref:Uncharacterized protein n=1 Tax=Zunongwangia pacifica TaxID=2911062 RepID=A0A9X1ZXR4_9FLAO|nr:hypothetical protein [Zunongwangia pacifica]MCL6219623.1 hypothetical protein [Zunongwangia pacifica]